MRMGRTGAVEALQVFHESVMSSNNWKDWQIHVSALKSAVDATCQREVPYSTFKNALREVVVNLPSRSSDSRITQTRELRDGKSRDLFWKFTDRDTYRLYRE